jgi:hypothetical protein
MRRAFIALLVFALLLNCSLPAMARGRLTPGQIKKIEQRVKKMSVAERRATAQSLNVRLNRLHKEMKVARMTARRRAILEADIERIERELALIKALNPPPRPAVKPPPPKLGRPVVKQQPQPQPRPVQFGVSAGYLSGMLGAMGEVRFHNPMELLRTSLRLGAAYAQGEDTAGTMRKHALIITDIIYRLNPPQARGIRSYVGGGLNYDAYTTGQTSGDLGYQVFYGIEGGRRSQMFFEIGYGTVRTGFSPDYTGLTALIGYKF